jgi:photosystem II stability/assembly factor-like uncharacterized protein
MIILCLLLERGAFADEGWKLIGPGDADMVMSLSFVSDEILFAGTDIGGLYMTRDSGKTWQSCNTGLKNYDITTPVIADPRNPKILYVGTRGGFYKSADMGKTWKPKRNGLPDIENDTLSSPVGAIAVSSEKSGVIYMGFGYPPHRDISRLLSMKSLRKGMKGFFYRSGDGGETWKAVSLVQKDLPIRCIALSAIAKGCIYLAADAGIFMSPDGGVSWKKILDSEARYVLSGHPERDELLAAMGPKGILRSKDRGKTWEVFNQGLPVGKGNNYTFITGTGNGNYPLYALNSTWKSGGGLYCLSGPDQQWTRITRWRGPKKMPESWLESSRRLHAMAISPSNPNQIFIGSSRYIYSSDDSGTSWNQLISVRKPSGGWTHRGMNVFGQTCAIAIDPSEPKRIYVGTGDHGMVKTEDGGISWLPCVQGMRFNNGAVDIAISRKNPAAVYAITRNRKKQYTVERSDTSGSLWYPVHNGLPESRWYCLLVDPVQPDTIYVGGKNGVYHTKNGGASWTPINRGLIEAPVKYLTGDSSKILYAGTDSGLYKSADSGNNWNKVGTLNFIVHTVLTDQTDPNILFAGVREKGKQKGGLYRSADGGRTWETVIADVRWVSSVVQIPSHPNIFYACTYDQNYHDECVGSGVFRSSDKGKTWESLNQGLAVLKAIRLEVSPVSPHKIYLCSDGSGVYVRDAVPSD